MRAATTEQTAQNRNKLRLLLLHSKIKNVKPHLDSNC